MLQGFVHPDFGHVAKVFSDQMPQKHPGGGAVCIYHKGECVADMWTGKRNQTGDPWQQETLALSYSTSKGVASTLLHILADRGLVDYATPVAEYWPEFAGQGKGKITVRHLLCHEAGLYNVVDLVDMPDDIYDWQQMTTALADAVPSHEPGETHGYHALTYGWLVGELIQRVSGKTYAEVLHEYLVEPLDLDGMYVGLPRDKLTRAAELIAGNQSAGRKIPAAVTITLNWGLGFLSYDLEEAALALPAFMSELDLNSEQALMSCMPAINGMFTARSLAKMYALLAGGGELNGTRLLSEDRLDEIMEVQNRGIGKVIPVSMQWRLGFHRAFTFPAHRMRRGFGHYGYGGSGAWADPDRNLAFGFVVNSGAGTPFGDGRILKLTHAALHCVNKR